ncbi:MAG TPA: DEAD/DEAH box helicase [Mucilaginibacter sp.]|nr:DEAD/DEAH box helicase [Mucilaginibacter sp.]
MSSKPTLNSDQKEAFKAIQKFLEHSSANIFVLKGYAGTGKTFLMQYLGQWLSEKEQSFCLLASTGRAASVLKGKTGFSATTVHSELYNFSKVDGIDDQMLENISEIDLNGQMSLQFTTRQPDKETQLYIVDEASMLSGDLSKDVLFAQFGSGVLLNDFFEVTNKNKIIFVGDPCQLPPVNQHFSPALEIKWLNEQDKVALSFTLEKIERTEASNDVLKLAGAVRNMSLQKEWELYPKLPASNLNNVKLHGSDQELFNLYLEKYKQTGINETIAIARSNAMVSNINKAMRRELFGSIHMPLQIGEVLLVTQNNYIVPLTNGDFVIIEELGTTSTRARLKFQNVRVKSVTTDKDYSILLSLDSLNSIRGNLSNNQMKELMIDFSQRMREKNVKTNTPEYKKAMLEDDYLNCLKVSYGYAVTCHKAQGGEWNNVFLFLDNENNGMYSMPPHELCKWWYTAITRARRELHLVKYWWVI